MKETTFNVVLLLSICMGCVLQKKRPNAIHRGKTVSFIYKDAIPKNMKCRKYKGRLRNPAPKIDIKEPEKKITNPFDSWDTDTGNTDKSTHFEKKKKKAALKHTGANSQVYRRCRVGKWEFVGYYFKDTVMTG